MEEHYHGQKKDKSITAPLKKIQKFFTCIPGKNMKCNKSYNIYKRHLDERLKMVPDQPRG